MNHVSAASPFALAIHGGSGTMRREGMGADLEAAYREALTRALDAGYGRLEAGGDSLSAVTAAVLVLEDCPLFNAGHGAVLNAEGACELDAAVMDGRTRAAGAVAGVRRVRNPVQLARAVLADGAHVLLVGPGADDFARREGLAMVAEDYFVTAHRRREWEEARVAQARGETFTGLERVPVGGAAGLAANPVPAVVAPPGPLGTVGAVALDRHGHLAAATSTGGMTLKRFGRVGDSALVGAGTYADDATCAVSATGHGEFFIRAVAAHDAAARMRYGGRTLAQAAGETIAAVGALGGAGGLIAVDRAGNVALPFNTPGMFRACRRSGGPAAFVGINHEAGDPTGAGAP